MMALNSIMVKMRLKMYDWVTSANQRDKIMLLSKTTVFMRLTFSNILFMYCCGPFQKARPVSAAITAIVKIHTNFPGDVTIENTFMMLTKSRRKQMPNAAKALVYSFLSDKREKIFSVVVRGRLSV